MARADVLLVADNDNFHKKYSITNNSDGMCHWNLNHPQQKTSFIGAGFLMSISRHNLN